MRGDGLMQGSSAPVGYLAVQVQPAQDSLFISKLYLHRNARGSGTGRVAMTFIEQLGPSAGSGPIVADGKQR